RYNVSAEAKSVENTNTAPKAESFEYNFIHPPDFRIERALPTARYSGRHPRIQEISCEAIDIRNRSSLTAKFNQPSIQVLSYAQFWTHAKLCTAKEKKCFEKSKKGPPEFWRPWNFLTLSQDRSGSLPSRQNRKLS